MPASQGAQLISYTSLEFSEHVLRLNASHPTPAKPNSLGLTAGQIFSKLELYC